MPACPPLTPARIGATPLTLPPLPFDPSAFEPVISAETFGFHHGKHHKGYIDTLQKLVGESGMADRTLEEIIFATAGKAAQAAIYQNAAQSWNHGFYWQSLSPEPRTPTGTLATVIDRDFGSLAALKAALAKAATGRFGSGWVWLVARGDTLSVMSTANADMPFTQGFVPLLAIDVWEHAYYLDWQNRRADHVEAVIDKHLDWDFAGRNYAG
jgi:superoxide dismutase, Fe-Mn family